MGLDSTVAVEQPGLKAPTRCAKADRSASSFLLWQKRLGLASVAWQIQASRDDKRPCIYAEEFRAVPFSIPVLAQRAVPGEPPESLRVAPLDRAGASASA